MSKLCGTSCETVKDELGGEASQREIICQAPHFASWLVCLTSPLVDCSTYDSLLAGYVIKNTINIQQIKATDQMILFLRCLTITSNFSRVEIFDHFSKNCNIICEHVYGAKKIFIVMKHVIFHWLIPNSIDIRLVCLKRVHSMTSPDIPYKGCFITSLTRQNKYLCWV